MNTLTKRIRILGAVLLAAGLAVAGVGLLYGAAAASDGLDSALAMYESQGVEINYNEEGQLVDRGDPALAQAIMAMLETEWKYPVNHANFDPNDPVVNTRDELMYQYAVITYHVLHGERAVTLTEADVPITYRGVTYTEPGVYQIAPMKYFGELDRGHPIEGQLREAWSPLALALVGTLAAGHANQAVGELALATSLGIGAIGGLFALAGAGLIWVSYGASSSAKARPVVAPSPLAAPPPALERVPVHAGTR
jgi:hypothetical protein